jgi:cellulose synthase/poly-beta-1,6-N-acetylglucosamine synthase-like glycosyltransferase
MPELQERLNRVVTVDHRCRRLLPRRPPPRTPTDPSNPRVEIVLSLIGVAVTLVAGCMVGYELSATLWAFVTYGNWGGALGHGLFSLIIAFLIYGGLVYQCTRYAYLRRLLRHQPASRKTLERLYTGQAPRVTILVPSYQEEREVVRQTLLSAGLQDYPNRRVVLLIDDPPYPGSREAAEKLEKMRMLSGELQDLLAEPARRYSAACEDYRARKAQGRSAVRDELVELAALHDEAAHWFTDQIRVLQPVTHVDHLFLDKTLISRRNELAARAHELRGLARRGMHALNLPATIEREYYRLATLFKAEITHFERKRYENLSHEPNKAMNLNSYIGLLGRHLREQSHGDRIHLESVRPEQADMHIPDTDYVLTLDADSILLPDYALRLVHFAESPGNEHTAVVQTPYSAFPEAPGFLERIAGATTDIQFIIHQGFTGCDATYWVGANALLRKTALADIAVSVQERGFPVQVFIQDRTVIEDTESTVDLIDRGWRLYNYPGRLAYSATPPDFGSLIIQRRRWANGGLIILPKLLRYLGRGLVSGNKLAEAVMRVHYLSSIAAVNLGLLILLAIPFIGSNPSFWLPLSAVSYFILYARDLQLIGYRASDVVRVYALNLVLIPVNLAGVLMSLKQAWMNAKIPFGRTPKVNDRTGIAPQYVLAEYALLLQWLIVTGLDAMGGLWFHALFVGLNAAALLYGITVFIGHRNSWEDLQPLVWRYLEAFTAHSRRMTHRLCLTTGPAMAITHVISPVHQQPACERRSVQAQPCLDAKEEVA